MQTSSENFYHLSSSFRVSSPQETLVRAKEFARRFGISRVTDITRLDCIGVPVFSSIRPTAMAGSLCVNAGKGIEPIEAQVGAYMEAIEFAMAEHGQSEIKCLLATPREVLDGSTRQSAILDFCPRINIKIDLNSLIECVVAEEILSGRSYFVPAELVFFPYKPMLGGVRYFSATTNGLCSGNSVFEASLHGIAELIERDIQSFQALRDKSALVNQATLPANVASLKRKIEEAGFNLYVRYTENSFGIPFFRAIIAEPGVEDPLQIFGGYGCHPVRQIALVRAVCEAAQSRLTLIHGGRDDIVRNYAKFQNRSVDECVAYAKKFIAEVTDNKQRIDYQDIEDPGAGRDINGCFQTLVDAMARVGLHKICRVVFTKPSDPLQVVRIIVPGLEYFTETTQRVGLRLRNFIHDKC